LALGPTGGLLSAVHRARVDRRASAVRLRAQGHSHLCGRAGDLGEVLVAGDAHPWEELHASTATFSAYDAHAASWASLARVSSIAWRTQAPGASFASAASWSGCRASVVVAIRLPLVREAPVVVGPSPVASGF